MDVTIDTVSAELQREPANPSESTSERRGRREPAAIEWPELAFGTRRERLRARLATY